jgi:hypothetical protein
MKILALILVLMLAMAASVLGAAYNSTSFGFAPANNTIYTSGDVTFNFRAYTNDSAGTNCKINTSAVITDTFYSTYWTFGVSNKSLNTFRVQSIADSASASKYYWFVNCSSAVNASFWNSSLRYYYIVDSLSPNIQVKAPSAASSTSSSGNVSITLNVTDANADTCLLYGNVNLTSNATISGYINLENKTYTTGTNFTFSEPVNRRLLQPGTFNFYAVCNDTAAHTATSAIQTVKVARGGINAVNCVAPTNLSMHSKLSTFNWSNIASSVFGYYLLSINDSVGNLTTVKVMSNSTFSYQKALLPDATYRWYVTAYDSAGTANSTGGNCNFSNSYVLYTTSVCSDLIAGWNACSWNKDAVYNQSLSAIATLSGATTVSAWNYTGNSFVSYVGTAANADYNVSRGDVVWIYAPSAVSWENQWTANSSMFGRQIMNTSNVSNVPIPVTNFTGYAIKWASDRINSSCDFVYSATLFNQPAGRYVNFFCGLNESNASVARFGSVLWIDFNDTRRSGFNYSG